MRGLLHRCSAQFSQRRVCFGVHDKNGVHLPPKTISRKGDTAVSGFPCFMERVFATGFTFPREKT